MKRKGHLLEAIADPENLRLAFWNASKGKRGHAVVRRFREHLDDEIEALRQDLLAECVKVGDYHFFDIHDPKPRRICAASFRVRVLHHAIINLCGPILDRTAIADSYACRAGKGRLADIERAEEFARRSGWFLKLDVRRYFDSINHELLKGLLRRRFKDQRLLVLLGRIVESYSTAPGCGLPIGNLTSQHFANYYLPPLDRFVKETLRRQCYVRYMDDFVVWGDNSADLKRGRDQVRNFLQSTLGLSLKNEGQIDRSGKGMDFLGYRIFPQTTRLSRRSKLRFRRKLKAYEGRWMAGEWTEETLQRHAEPLLAFVRGADSEAFRRAVLSDLRVGAEGLEPREPRRQLEQCRTELPVGAAQQQLAVESEQQPRVPGRAGPSSTGTEFPADPAPILSSSPCGCLAKAESPLGVSSPLEGEAESSGRAWPRQAEVKQHPLAFDRSRLEEGVKTFGPQTKAKFVIVGPQPVIQVQRQGDEWGVLGIDLPAQAASFHPGADGNRAFLHELHAGQQFIEALQEFSVAQGRRLRDALFVVEQLDEDKPRTIIGGNRVAQKSPPPGRVPAHQQRKENAGINDDAGRVHSTCGEEKRGPWVSHQPALISSDNCHAASGVSLLRRAMLSTRSQATKSLTSSRVIPAVGIVICTRSLSAWTAIMGRRYIFRRSLDKAGFEPRQIGSSSDMATPRTL
ncbi:MAG: hypothetical protein FJ398_15210 [Verrucomicrobia bacterium]|nr:hypothetical protein [Verrucomicrobiota bacterium]